MRYQIEITDTFGGQANYSWVRREVFEEPRELSELQFVRAVKRLAGFNGVKGLSQWYGDTYEFRPYNAHIVMFVTPMEDE